MMYHIFCTRKLTLVRVSRTYSSWIHKFLYGESNDSAHKRENRAVSSRMECESSRCGQKTLLDKQKDLDDVLAGCVEGNFSELARPQVLAKGEQIFSHQIPNTLLSTLKTPEDVRSYFTGVTDVPESEKVATVPAIQPDSLPPNLSVEYVPLRVRRKRLWRIPFANYSDPRHAQFPTKYKEIKDWKGRPIRLRK